MYREIIEREIYRFRADSNTPRIVDGGANVGLSAIYFKNLYPQSRIVAFEPDSQIAAMLTDNLHTFGYSDVEIVTKALWSSSCRVGFHPDGGAGGRLVPSEQFEGNLVDTVALSDYLSEEVDLLKLDVEGVETEILESCADNLNVVKRIFVEYHSFIEQDQTLPALLDILRTAGFRLFLEHTGEAMRQPFCAIGYCDNMDMQLNIFASRVSSTDT